MKLKRISVIIAAFLVGGLLQMGCFYNTGTELPPLEILAENMQEMDITVVHTIESLQKGTQDQDVVEYRITAKVVKVFVGDMTPEASVQYVWDFEPDDPLPAIGAKYIGSLKKIEPGLYAVTDLGYNFLYSKQLEKRFHKAMK